MFKTERDMMDLLMTNINPIVFGERMNKHTSMQWFAELNLGYGVADLVITNYKSCNIKRNGVLNKFDIAVYMVFERDRNWLTPAVVHDRTKTAITLVNRAVKRLVEEGFIRARGGMYRFYRKYRPDISTSIAIEAKLTNWKRALKQAYRYNWFSNYAYVVLPKSKARPAQANLEMFKKMKVGLATIDSNGSIDVIYTPKRTKPYDTSMSYLLNENLLSKWLEKAQPSR